MVWRWGIAIDSPWGRLVISWDPNQRLCLSWTVDPGVGYPSAHQRLRMLTVSWRRPRWVCLSEIVDFST